MISILTYMTIILFFFSFTDALSNYDRQGISQNYTEGLPEFAVVNGLDSDFMNITLTFQQKFYGIVYADYNSKNNDYDRTCTINGNGELKKELILSLKGCGTVQSPARVFMNNIIVRFHPGLEMDGDEVITTICRYPEPRVITHPALPSSLKAGNLVPIQTFQPLRDFEVLLIICAIIFLALLLLGFGCSYYCLKKRNIKVVRKRPASTLGSEITKMSDPMSMFSGLKIPRAHAVESSGSEQLTESIHTEYNSEEASGTSEEEYHSTYSDQACEISEGVIFSQVKDPSMPEFDVKAIIKRSEIPRSPESSRMSSDSELILKAQEQFLTTILERTETNTKETLERVRRLEAKKGPPPVHARIRVHNKQLSDTSEMESESEFSQVQSEYYEDDMCLESRDTTNALMEQKNEFDVNIKTRPKEIHYTTDEDSSVMFSDNESIHPYRSNQTLLKQLLNIVPESPPQLPPSSSQTTTHTRTDYHARSREPPQLPPTSSQTNTHTRTDYVLRSREPPQLPPGEPQQLSAGEPQTGVYTRSNYPGKLKEPEKPTLPRTTHHTSTSTNYTINEQNRTHIENLNISPRQPDEMSQITTSGLSITDVHARDRFDVFIRVLDPPEYTDTYDEISSIFTEDERIRIREVILQDVKVQKLIETATTTNDFIHIKNQKSLQSVVEPQKWDVLIRILQNPVIYDDQFERESSRSTKTGFSNQELRSLSEVMVDLDRRSIPGSSQINTPTVIYDDPHGQMLPPSSGLMIPGGGVRDKPQGGRLMPQGMRDKLEGRRDMPQGGRDMPQGEVDLPQGAHYVVTDTSRPGMTSHQVNYYSSSPTRSQTIMREFMSGSQQIQHNPFTQTTTTTGVDGTTTTVRREIVSNAPDVLAPIVHRENDEISSTIQRVLQTVSQQEGFDIRYGFPEGKDPKSSK
ncbi:unnamed protein product [Lepeophtheirus salmonis]|uniref:(salmon louse) hypothetical protein n=1 Tax=Lepeophtheirus salmonis TaxID=72036 RepID=A0A7R8CHG4_LEPSM|nr:unnamed protein product [Lepeophtheirus salmonis]CAF2767367.1 unnamed protein product [Lepeophtheirus salmonis]